MLEEGIVTYLTSVTVLVALQGNRVWPNRLPQNPTLPATTFREISNVPEYSHNGPSGYENVRMQFNCWATDPLAAKQLARALKRALSGFKGMMGSSSIGGCFLANSMDDFDDPTGLSRVIVDFEFEYEIGE